MDRQELGIRMEPDYFGPLWRYVRNDKITDIDYNGNQLWITDVENERYLIRSHGITEKFVEQFSHRIANEVSKPFNKKNNLLEAETNTLRISIVHESVAISGRSICIRKSMPMLRMQVKRMVEDEYVAVPVLELLTNCVAAKMNFVFCGEPGAGKTECAKFFSQFIPAGERVITIIQNGITVRLIPEKIVWNCELIRILIIPKPLRHVSDRTHPGLCYRRHVLRK